MDKEKIKKLFEEVITKRITIDEAIERLKILPFLDLGHTKLDTHREIRRGIPEVIYCKGKSIKQILDIFNSLKDSKLILATKATKDIYVEVKKFVEEAKYYEDAKMIVVKRGKSIRKKGNILIITAGTSDIPVAEEAYVTCLALDNKVKKIYDVGSAGVHRLLNFIEKIREARVMVVVAGMDGVLPTIVSSLVEKPVIAVPTSTGYGINLNGISPLLTMLNSCSPGIAVVNIDNGFGAGYLAHLINNL